jgi:hypothetical protein
VTATIWKFPIPVDDAFVIPMPTGAAILHVDVALGKPWIWAIVDPDADREDRFFRLFGTGMPLPGEGTLTYRGTFLLEGGVFVGHVFEDEQGV